MTVTVADGPVAWSAATALVRDFAAWLAEAGGVDLRAAQAGFAEEVADLRRTYTPPRGRFFLAAHDGVPVGCGGLRVHSDGRGELKRLYVRPGARGLRAGDALVTAILDAASGYGLGAVWLETGRGLMEPAIALYRRHGFAVEATRSPTLEDPRLITMVRPLPGAGSGGLTALSGR